jgi:hypothetical protein
MRPKLTLKSKLPREVIKKNRNNGTNRFMIFPRKVQSPLVKIEEKIKLMRKLSHQENWKMD